ncbi:MAG TPA: hypothetical protein VGA36_03880 [Nitriliruptorales bacterium]
MHERPRQYRNGEPAAPTERGRPTEQASSSSATSADEAGGPAATRRPGPPQLATDAWAAINDGYRGAATKGLGPIDRARRRFLADLLGGTGDEVGLLEQARNLGLRVTGRSSLLVVVAHRSLSCEDDIAAAVAKATAEISVLVPAGTTELLGDPARPRGVAVVPSWDARTPQRLARLGDVARRNHVVVVVTTSTRLVVLGDVYCRHRDFLSPFGRVTLDPCVAPMARTSLYGTLLRWAPGDARRHVQETFGLVLAQHDRAHRCLPTVERLDHHAWAAAQVASKLGITERTVRNHCGEFAAATGLDLDNSDDAAALAFPPRGDVRDRRPTVGVGPRRRPRARRTLPPAPSATMSLPADPPARQAALAQVIWSTLGPRARRQSGGNPMRSNASPSQPSTGRAGWPSSRSARPMIAWWPAMRPRSTRSAIRWHCW